MIAFPKDYGLRDRIEALRIEARELRDEGRLEDAQQLDDKADRLEAGD